MSLYDKYHSEHNKQYMYDLIKKIILKETGFDISNNGKYQQIYNSNYSGIFQSINTDSIIELNKELLDSQTKIFLDDINLSKQDTLPDARLRPGPNNSSVTKISDILQERKIQDNEFMKMKSNESSEMKITSIESPKTKITSMVLTSLKRQFDIKSSSFHFKYKVKQGSICSINSLMIPLQLNNPIQPYLVVYSDKESNVIEIDTIVQNFIMYKPINPIKIKIQDTIVPIHCKNIITKNTEGKLIKIKSIQTNMNQLHITIPNHTICNGEFIKLKIKDKIDTELHAYLSSKLFHVTQVDTDSIICDWNHKTFEIIAFASDIYLLESSKQIFLNCDIY